MDGGWDSFDLTNGRGEKAWYCNLYFSHHSIHLCEKFCFSSYIVVKLTIQDVKIISEFFARSFHFMSVD